jgi:Zn-finger nucleic acid-binding protein
MIEPMILACPGCDSRYDVSGYPVGQQFRCRCGTVTMLEAPSSQAGLLACPRCGAGVAPNASACEHCSAELLLKACPRCLSRVFHGHKHCPECGSELDLAASGDVHVDHPCPRCESMLRPRLVGDIVIDECAQCLGLFLDQIAIKRVVTDREQARADALLGALPKQAVSSAVKPGQKMYLKCPICRTVMNRKQFAAGAGVVVDVCKHHGTYFDVGELPAIIEFVKQGGLELAAKREVERQRAEVRAERDRLRASAADSMRFEAHTSHHHSHSTGRAFVDLLFSLFG